MASLVIKKLPDDIHAKLKSQAKINHRSMAKEAIALLEQALETTDQVREFPPPYEGNIKLTSKFINNAKRSGRA